jgi:hypothetical protein
MRIPPGPEASRLAGYCRRRTPLPILVHKAGRSRPAPPDSHRRTRTAGQGDFLRHGFLRSEFADFSMERPIVSDLFSRPQGDRFGRRAENAFRKGHRLRLFFVNNLLISLDNIEQGYRVSRGVLRQ